MSLIKDIHPTYNIYNVTADLNDADIEYLKQEAGPGINGIINHFSVKKEDAASLSEALRELNQYMAKEMEATLVIVVDNPEMMEQLRETELHLSVNICPTLQEAVDIISMDILERDLLKEE